MHKIKVNMDKEISWKIRYFFEDKLGSRNYIWQPDGKIAVVDGLDLMPSRASSEKQEKFFSDIIDQELEKIMGNFPKINV